MTKTGKQAIESKYGGKISGTEGFKKFLEADGGDNLLGFIGKNLLLFLVIAAAIITTLFAPIARFPANDNIAKTGIVFAFLVAEAGLRKGNADRIFSSLLSKIPDRFRFLTPALIIIGAFLFGAVFTPLGAVLLLLLTALPLCKVWHKTALFYSLCLFSANLGGFLIPTYIERYVLRAAELPYFEYLTAVLPLALAGLFLCLVPILIFGKADGISAVEKKPVDIITICIYSVVFILCVLSAFGIIDIIISFCSAVLAAVILDSDNIKKVDYGLLVIIFLLTVVSWNILRTDMLPLPESPLSASVFITGLTGSDNAILLLFPKNVPALTLLSGVNIGSLGIFTASGLYTYRRYLDTVGAKPISGLLIFAGLGLIFITVLSALAAI
jgi:hypothetical protein